MGNMLKCSTLHTDKRKTGKIELESKEEHFIRNGAVLLEKQISIDHGKGMNKEPLRIFSAKLIMDATNHLDPSLIIGRRVATIFKGLVDGRAVAVKVMFSPTLIDFVLNQVVVKQVITHRNTVRLYGCCLETAVPVLVYEFLHNGTLDRRLHNHGNGATRLSWFDRVRIATETAHALCYMHYGTAKPLVHLDVSSPNIFLDDSFTAKLSNFGFAVSITPGEVFRSEAVEGSIGYIDPEYEATRQVTEKCDVYSFGILLLELLTNIDPVMCNLVNWFELAGDRLMEEIAEEEAEAFAELALRCVSMKGEERPSMKEVALELKRIKHGIGKPESSQFRLQIRIPPYYYYGFKTPEFSMRTRYN